MERHIHWPNFPHSRRHHLQVPQQSWGEMYRKNISPNSWAEAKGSNRLKHPLTLLGGATLFALLLGLSLESSHPATPVDFGPAIIPALESAVSAACKTTTLGLDINIYAHPSKMPPDIESIVVTGKTPGGDETIFTSPKIETYANQRDFQITQIQPFEKVGPRVVIQASLPNGTTYTIGTIDGLKVPNGQCFIPAPSPFSSPVQ